MELAGETGQSFAGAARTMFTIENVRLGDIGRLFRNISSAIYVLRAGRLGERIAIEPQGLKRVERVLARHRL